MGYFSLGGSYICADGVVYGFAVAVVYLLSFVGWNYQFKWKAAKRRALSVLTILVTLIVSVIYVAAIAEHLLTGAEKFVLALNAAICLWLGATNYTRCDEYNERLGQILGFKNFIVYTEQDKIEFMLKENPELFYDVLPYAQVLGVTNEWTGKFEEILLTPPSWYASSGGMSVFDFYILNRCMRVSMVKMMSRPSGNSVGRSGGGGGFGGFSGGGHGGGGFGAR